MSDFRKSYEYEEEKGLGGFLAVFFVMLLSVEVLLAVMILVQGNAALKTVPYLGTAFLVLGTGYLILISITCIALKRMSRSAVALSRILLITRVLFLTPACILLFTTFANNPGSYSDFSSRNGFVVFALVVPLAYILLFSTLWYLYFSISRRVKQLSQAVSVRRGDRVDVSSS